MGQRYSENMRIVGVLADLFFIVKIIDAAKKAGMTAEFVKERAALLAKAKDHPALIIFDLNFDAAEPLNLIAELKNSAELKSIALIGFLSHVQGELKQKAQEAGCDIVLARSAFSQNLPEILKTRAGVI
jgi:PleD family two-component response regulator